MVITVKQVVSDYVQLRIVEKYHFDSDRIVKGLTDIFANHGLKIKFTVPQSKDLKAIKKHYSAIVKQITLNVKHSKAPDDNFEDSVFYSFEKYSDLCVADVEKRYTTIFSQNFRESNVLLKSFIIN